MTRATAKRPEWGAGSMTRRLVWLAIALIAAVAIRPEPVVAAAAGLALIILAVLLAEPVARELDVRVSSTHERVTVGEAVRVDVEIDVGAGPAVPVTATPLLAEGLGVVRRQPWQPLPGGPMPLTIQPRRWMRGRVGELHLRLATPLGGRVGYVAVELPVLVAHPRTRPSPAVYAPPHLLSRFGTHPGRQRGPGSEFAELREYATGDPLRTVDWKSSARMRRLMVSQRSQDQAADVVVLVDHTSVVGGYDRRLHDRAVQGASVVARAYLAAGDRVGLVMFGSAVRWLPPGQGRMHETRILDDLILRPLVTSLLDPDLARVPAVSLPPRSIVFCFSSLLDDRMVAAIARLAERGHRLVVIDTIGIQPERWPTGTSARTRVEWPRHRRLLRSRLGELGAIVIDDVDTIGTAVRGMSRPGVAR